MSLTVGTNGQTIPSQKLAIGSVYQKIAKYFTRLFGDTFQFVGNINYTFSKHYHASR